MKPSFSRLVLASFVLTAATSVYAATEAPAPTNLNVSVNSDSRELASGFSQAASRLHRLPFHVQLQHANGRPMTIPDVKSISASGGVLVVETTKGLIYLVNPQDVIWISDTPVEKPASPAPETK